MWNNLIRRAAALVLLAAPSFAALPRTVTDAQQAYIVHQPFSMNLGFSYTNTGVLLPFKIDPVSGGLLVTLTTSLSGESDPVAQGTSPWIESISSASFGGSIGKPLWVTDTPTGGGATNIWGTVTANAGTGTFSMSPTGAWNQAVSQLGAWTFSPSGTFNVGAAQTGAWTFSPAGTGWLQTVAQGTSPWTTTPQGGYVWTRFDPNFSLPTGANVIGAVTQSGTWTVQPGNTANTTPWLWTYSPTATSMPLAVTPISSGPQVPFTFTHTGNLWNTAYIQSMTVSTTGNGGWIDCRNVKKVTFIVKFAPDTDVAAVIGAGVTNYIDADGGFSSDQTAVSTWNTQVGAPLITKANQEVTIPDPPMSLRWRCSGVWQATISVQYKLELY